MTTEANSIDLVKFDKAAECIQGISDEISVDTAFGLLRSFAAKGLLSSKRDQRSFEEKMEDAEESENIRTKVVDWLKNNEAPSYNKDLNNGLTLQHLIDKIGLTSHTKNEASKNRGILLSVLRTENTGWGVVDYIGDLEGKDKKPVFGKKAILISFRHAA